MSYCQICRVLHGINIDDIYSPTFNESKLLRPLFSDGVAPRRVANLTDWFYGEENEECFLDFEDPKLKMTPVLKRND